MIKKMKIALIFGGRSAEHEVSVKSVKNVCEALDKNRFEVFLIGISQSGTWFYFQNEKDIQSLHELKDEELKTKFPFLAVTSAFGKAQFLIQYDEFQDPKAVSNKTSDQFVVDVAFPIMHGTFGEDGCIQGLFRMLNLPFVGCGVLASSLCMDKDMMKRAFVQSGIPTSDWLVLNSWDTKRNTQEIYDNLVLRLGSPFFIKPANAGSSVGVHKIKNATEFEKNLKDSFLYDHKVLAEKFISGREIECSVLGLTSLPKASLPGEVIPQLEFYSYQAKYLDSNGALIRIPAELTQEVVTQIQLLAKKVFTSLSCSGLSRVDFFLTKENEIYVNEINTIPGFTNISMYPKMWEVSGLKYQDLLSELIDLALQQFELENRNYKFSVPKI